MSLIAPTIDPTFLPGSCDMTSEMMAITIKHRPNEVVYQCFKQSESEVEPSLASWVWESEASFWSTFSVTGTVVPLGKPGGVVNGRGLRESVELTANQRSSGHRLVGSGQWRRASGTFGAEGR